MLLQKTLLCDYKQVAQVHLNSFKGFFLTELGIKFLFIYYKSVLKSKNTISVCAINNNLIIGFITGCTLSKGYNKNLLLANLFSFSLFALQTLFTKPKSLIRLFNNFNKIKNSSDDGMYSEIQSIAVLPEFKGKGIGEALVKEFEKIAIEKKIDKITLTTDYYDNDSVVNFYKRNGYTVFYDFMAYPNRRMYKLIKNLKST